jgi:multidrug efflux pump subunit AcrA (membrane-fusion protein)
MEQTRIPALVAVLLICVGVAGCNGDDPNASQPSAVQATVTVTKTAPPAAAVTVTASKEFPVPGVTVTKTEHVEHDVPKPNVADDLNIKPSDFTIAMEVISKDCSGSGRFPRCR